MDAAQRKSFIETIVDFIRAVKMKLAGDGALLNSLNNLEKRYVKMLNAAIKANERAENRVVNKGGVSYSLGKSFGEQVDDVLNGNHNPRYDLYVSNTPQYLIDLNFSDDALLMRNGKVKEILEKHPEMNAEIIKKIPSALKNPLLVLKSKTNPTVSVVVITDIMTSNGEMIIPVWVSQEGNYIDVDLSEKSTKTNFVASSYGRPSKGLIEYAVNNDGVLYQNPEIEKVRDLLARNGLQLPTPLKISNSVISVSDSSENVKKNFSIPENNLMDKYSRLDLNQDMSGLDGVPAIRLKDGSILPFTEKNGRRMLHVEFIKENRISADDIESGGWIGNGVYDPSYTSDTQRYIDQMQAKKRVAEATGKPFAEFDNVSFDIPDDYTEYDKPITLKDVSELRSIVADHGGERVSINDFTSEDIKKSQKWAYKFNKELGTKSPFFRARFGDWRANDLNNVTITDTESDTRGEHYNTDTKWIINRSSKVSGERHSSTASVSGRNYLKYIDGLIRNSVLLDSAVSDKQNENSIFFHYLYGVVRENGHNSVIKLTVEEQEIPVKGDIKRAYKLIDITKHQPRGGVSANGLNSSRTADAIVTISDLYDFVKTYDKDFRPGKAVNPEMLNEDGTPKKFYHGAKKNGGFTVFRNWQYFTPNKEYAERYAERGNAKSLYAVYLQSDKIFDTRNANARRIFNQIRAEYGLGEIQDSGLPDWTDGYDITEYLSKHPELGYDAVLLDEGGDLVNGKPVSRGTSIIIKDSSQVKSATDNIGTYDPNSKDIRFDIPNTAESNESTENLRERAKELTEQYDNGEISEEEYRNGMAEIWVEQGEKVGTIPEGENAKDDYGVPKKDLNGRKVRRFARTILEKGNLPQNAEH